MNEGEISTGVTDHISSSADTQMNPVVRLFDCGKRSSWKHMLVNDGWGIEISGKLHHLAELRPWIGDGCWRSNPSCNSQISCVYSGFMQDLLGRPQVLGSSSREGKQPSDFLADLRIRREFKAFDGHPLGESSTENWPPLYLRAVDGTYVLSSSTPSFGGLSSVAQR